MKDEPYTYKVKNPNFKYAKLDEADGKYYDKYGNEQKEYNEKGVEKATMFDINTAIMRCLVKNIAMFGLGLYIYAGEDLPQEEKKEEEPKLGSKPKLETIKLICKKHNIDADGWVTGNGRTWETLTEEEATQMLVTLKKKYGDD